MKTIRPRIIILTLLPIATLAVLHANFMPLTLSVQDKAIALTSDCGVTRKTIRLVPRSPSPENASLRYLFAHELSHYAIYDSLTVKDGIATILLESQNDPSGRKIGALSSCEGGHLFSVLKDTLKPYGIHSVELYTKDGKIEF